MNKTLFCCRRTRNEYMIEKEECGENHIAERKDCKIENSNPVAILNGAVITAEGDYSCRTISLEEAKKIVYSKNNVLSAVGHQATAEIITDLLGIKVAFNRINFQQKVGQQALVFKLNIRPPEGTILSRNEIEEIGYYFQLMTRNA